MSNNISTFDLTKFKHSIHFEERALERFNVTSLQMNTFIKENSPVYDTHLSPIENRKQTLSKNGIMFILDVDKKEIVTVYKSISPQIAQTKQASFQNELNQMIAKYQVATAQEYLQAVGENINRFNSVSQILMTSDPKHLNFNMVEQVFKDVTIIKSALKLLSKQNDFYQEFSNNYDPLKYLNFSDLDDLDEHFDTPKSFTPLPKMTETSVTEQLTLNEVIIEPQKLRVKTVEPKELSVKTETTNNPTDYEPKISNKQVLKNEKPLKEILDGSDKQQINNKLTQFGQSKLAQNVMKAIKQGITKSELLKLIKPQLKVIDYQQFTNMLGRLLKK